MAMDYITKQSESTRVMIGNVSDLDCILKCVVPLEISGRYNCMIGIMQVPSNACIVDCRVYRERLHEGYSYSANRKTGK